MPPGLTSLMFLLLNAFSAWCFVDECNSLDARGLRTQTQNMTLNFSFVEPITDRHRFTRDVSDDGFVQYVSPVGFESVAITGYAYNSSIVDSDWQFELRTAEELGDTSRRARLLNASNLAFHKAEWNGRENVETNWVKFRIELSKLPRCPKVIELWFQGNATVNMFPGWGLQVGRVRLEESRFQNCEIPRCLENSNETRCFASLSKAAHSLQLITDSTSNFNEVFYASSNIDIGTENALAHFSGDSHRFQRTNAERGIITYHIPEGIAVIEITLFRCNNYRPKLLVVPYLDPVCKPSELQPSLEDDSYYSGCWKRFKAKFDFRELLDCPPTYVDLVIEGRDVNALQISTVDLHGYGSNVQDPMFQEEKQRTNEDDHVVLNAPTTAAAESGSSTESVKLEHWLPATIIGGIVIIAILVGILLYKNGEVRDFIADYIEDNFPFIYKHFYPPDPPPQPSTPRAQTRGMHPHFTGRSFASGSINYSCTFDNTLKNTHEPPVKRDVTATRDGFGEQLIDLSKHLQRAFWTSKVGKKQRFLEIEERLGKGGFGQVWKARWQGTPVALKVVPLHANLRQEEKQARMAIMEAALSGCLAHPNIVSTYACEIREANDFDNDTEPMSVEDSQNRQNWTPIERFALTNASKSFMKPQAKNDLEVRIIMEYCDRGSLVAAISRGWFRNPEDPTQPDFDSVILTALDIARGLCCLHENNIIHGDLKPHNVLLQNKPFVDSRGFIAKIADFGLSIKMDSEQSHVDGMRMGTGGYVSPEVAVRGKILPASDIYSFGILLWELFTGELIQDAIKDAPKVSSRLTMGSWRPIFQEDCPQAYSRLACMCWNDFPDWRPTLDYILDELNGMLKPREQEVEHKEREEPPLGDCAPNEAPTMTLP